MLLSMHMDIIAGPALFSSKNLCMRVADVGNGNIATCAHVPRQMQRTQATLTPISGTHPSVVKLDVTRGHRKVVRRHLLLRAVTLMHGVLRTEDPENEEKAVVVESTRAIN